MTEFTLEITGEELVFLQQHLQEYMVDLERNGVTTLMDKLFDAELRGLYKDHCKGVPVDERDTFEEFCAKLEDPEYIESMMQKENESETWGTPSRIQGRDTSCATDSWRHEEGKNI